MTWGHSFSYPRAILHVDGDSFFASCEVAKDPALRGKPVITGKERGIVSACTYDLKKRGIKRGMKLTEVRAIAPDAIILPSDYETYSLFSERMYAIVRRYTPVVEEYSIDECFAELTGLRRSLHMSYPDMVANIKRDLQRELGMTFSLGLSATKTLAKVGSKWEKPDGLTLLPLKDAAKFLAKISAGAIWGIGPNSAAYLKLHGIRTAFDFAHKDEVWVRANLHKPLQEIWQELNGTPVLELSTERKESYQSISKTKTFTPPSRSAAFVHSQLSKNVENACIKARRWNLAAPEIAFFLKTQDFNYFGCEIKLSNATNVPHDMLRAIDECFPRVFRQGALYRATGIALLKLREAGGEQLDLFGAAKKTEGLQMIFKQVDHLSEKYGKHAVFLGSSFQAMTHSAHAGERGDAPQRVKQLFKGETTRRRLNIPMLGEVN